MEVVFNLFRIWFECRMLFSFANDCNDYFQAQMSWFRPHLPNSDFSLVDPYFQFFDWMVQLLNHFDSSFSFFLVNGVNSEKPTETRSSKVNKRSFSIRGSGTKVESCCNTVKSQTKARIQEFTPTMSLGFVLTIRWNMIGNDRLFEKILKSNWYETLKLRRSVSIETTPPSHVRPARIQKNTITRYILNNVSIDVGHSV